MTNILCFILFKPTTNLWWKHSFNFINEKAEAQKDQVTRQGHIARKKICLSFWRKARISQYLNEVPCNGGQERSCLILENGSHNWKYFEGGQCWESKGQGEWEKEGLWVQWKGVIEEEVGGLLSLFMKVISHHSCVNIIRATMWRWPSAVAHSATLRRATGHFLFGISTRESVLLLLTNLLMFIQWTPAMLCLVVFPLLLLLLSSKPSVISHKGSYDLLVSCLNLTLDFILVFNFPFPVILFYIYLSNFYLVCITYIYVNRINVCVHTEYFLKNVIYLGDGLRIPFANWRQAVAHIKTNTFLNISGNYLICWMLKSGESSSLFCLVILWHQR